MPKELIGMRARVALEERRMYAVVAGSSSPERALKNEVFRVCDALSSKEVGAVLGKVHARLGARERTSSMAEYMKDLYGSGARRLFMPRPIVGASKLKWKVKPVGMQQGLIEGVKLALTDGSVEKVPLVDVRTVTGALAGKPGKRKSFDKTLERAKAIAGANTKVTRVSKVAASVDIENNPPSGLNPNEVVTLQSVANYCLKTASRYSEVKPVYDMLVELFSEKSCPEWKEMKAAIKKRMDTLPGDSYLTVYGNLVEQQQITHNVEKVENGGVGIMEKAALPASKKDGRKKSGSSQKVVKAVYKYNHLNDKDGYRRLDLLYRALVHNEWLNTETLPDMFIDLFVGVPKEFTIKWLGTQAELYTLIKKLFDQGLIAGTKGGNKWDIAGSHFVNRQSQYYTNWNRQKECKKGQAFIEDCILLLNPSIPMTGELLRRLRIA